MTLQEVKAARAAKPLSFVPKEWEDMSDADTPAADPAPPTAQPAPMPAASYKSGRLQNTRMANKAMQGLRQRAFLALSRGFLVWQRYCEELKVFIAQAILSQDERVPCCTGLLGNCLDATDCGFCCVQCRSQVDPIFAASTRRMAANFRFYCVHAALYDGGGGGGGGMGDTVGLLDDTRVEIPGEYITHVYPMGSWA